MDDEFDYGIRNARLMNSRSFFSCDIYPTNPHSSIVNTPYLDNIPGIYRHIPAPDRQFMFQAMF